MAGRAGLKEGDVSGHGASGSTGPEAWGLPMARHAELHESDAGRHGTPGLMDSEAARLMVVERVEPSGERRKMARDLRV